MFDVMAPAAPGAASSEAADRPEAWTNPTPAGRYDLAVIGGGATGLTAAASAARLGARVALIERQRLGGFRRLAADVPRRVLIDLSRAASSHHIDFAFFKQRLDRAPAAYDPLCDPRQLAAGGIDVHIGHARFIAPDAVDVNDQTLQFHRAIIATGTRPAPPAITGLDDAGYLTDESLGTLTELPRRLAVLGAGPAACEYAQAFRRLGSEVFLIAANNWFLEREDPAAARTVLDQLCREGVHVMPSCAIANVERTGAARCVVVRQGDQTRKLFFDEILLAGERVPDVANLALDAAGIEFTPQAVPADDRLRTTNHRVFLARPTLADVCVRNALAYGRAKPGLAATIRVIDTDPQLAQVGLTAGEAAACGIAIDTHRVNLNEHEFDGPGFAAIHTRRGRGRIVGATIVARDAALRIAPIALAMNQGLPITALEPYSKAAWTSRPLPRLLHACHRLLNRSR